MPGEGDLILEVQVKTLKFLIKMVELILHDVEDLSLEALQSLPAQTELASLFGHINQANGEVLSLASVAAEMRYRVPTTAAFPILMRLVQTRVDSARDHAWKLRQDPGYYQDAVKAWSTWGSNQGQRVRATWNGPIWRVISHSCNVVTWWIEVQEAFQDVLDLEETLQQGREDKGLKEASEEYSEAIVNLVNTLSTASSFTRLLLKESLHCSPPLKDLWEEDDDTAESTSLVVKQHVPRGDRLPSLLSLLTRERISNQCPLHLIVEEVNQVLSNDTNQWAKITPLIASFLADIGVLEEIQRQIYQQHRKLFCPYCPWGENYRGKPKMGQTKYESNTSMLFNVYETLKAVDWTKCGSPTNEKFHYPAESSGPNNTLYK